MPSHLVQKEVNLLGFLDVVPEVVSKSISWLNAAVSEALQVFAVFIVYLSNRFSTWQLVGGLFVGFFLLHWVSTVGVSKWGKDERGLKKDLDDVESEFDKILKETAELQAELEKDEPEKSESEEETDPQEIKNEILRKAAKEEQQLRRRQVERMKRERGEVEEEEEELHN